MAAVGLLCGVIINVVLWDCDSCGVFWPLCMVRQLAHNKQTIVATCRDVASTKATSTSTSTSTWN